MTRLVIVSGLSCLLLSSSDVTLAEGVDHASAITPVADPGERRKLLASLPYSKRARFCRGRVHSVLFDVTARISGPVRRQVSNAQHAGIAISETIEAWYLGTPSASSHIRTTLREGAEIQAFTQLAPYSPPEYSNYNPMNEPVFQVANFLVPLAHAYLIAKNEFPEDTDLLTAVRHWGDRLHEITRDADDTFGGRSKGVDRRVSDCTGLGTLGQCDRQPEGTGGCLQLLWSRPEEHRTNGKGQGLGEYLPRKESLLRKHGGLYRWVDSAITLPVSDRFHWSQGLGTSDSDPG